MSVVAHSSVLQQVGDHDDDADILLPDHLPEVVGARPQGTLSGDVGPRCPEALMRCREAESNLQT